MSDKIKEVMQTPEVPEELKPENIPSLIEPRQIFLPVCRLRLTG